MGNRLFRAYSTFYFRFKEHPDVKSAMTDVQARVENGVITPGHGADILLGKFAGSDKNS